MSDGRHSGADRRAARLVVIAASYGGLGAVKTVLRALPEWFSAPIVVVQHRHPAGDFLASILARATALRVVEPESGKALEPGAVYVPPADRQATVDAAERIVLGRAHRGQADPLLESVASVYGDRAIAVVLTGQLDDAAAGAREIKRRGGRVLVQDEETSAAFAMPSAAIATGCVDFVLPLGTIAPALVALAMVPGADELFRVRLHPWAVVAAA